MGLTEGRPVSVGRMQGRSRLYHVTIPYAAPRDMVAIGFNDQCDVAVATVLADPGRLGEAEQLALDFLKLRSGSALGRGGARRKRHLMRSAVLVFPGINRERDMARALRLMSGRETAMVWHTDAQLPPGTDLVVVPGGFSYGDYLRCGAIAARAPVMDAVRRFAARRRPGAGRLQRLPDSVRGRAAPGRAHAQCRAQVHLPRRLSQGRALRQRRSPAATMPAR